MEYFLIPLLVVLAIGLSSLNIKIGFVVGDLTKNTGFDYGFYMMTVLGLFSAEASAIIYSVRELM